MRPGLVPLLVKQYHETFDQELLELIARFPAAIAAADADWLLACLEERYWRMRVVEGLLLNATAVMASYADSHPYEFAYAVGRTQSSKYLPTLHELVVQRSDDLDVLSIATWAFGKLGDRPGIALMQSIAKRLFEGTPSPLGMKKLSG